jgi:hypothetical protein
MAWATGRFDMSTRSQRAADVRASIVLQLGGRCCDCQALSNLELDFIGADPEAHHAMSYPDRQRWYLKQFGLGLLQCRCSACHRRVTADRERRRRRLATTEFLLAPQFPNFINH